MLSKILQDFFFDFLSMKLFVNFTKKNQFVNKDFLKVKVRLPRTLNDSENVPL